jgi:serine/threonine protein kinase
MSEEQIPQRIGEYEILGVLGAGGMGKVYKVRNTITDRVEAMKVLLPDLASDKELAERFLREIKLLATLNHPNIAALHTAVRVDNQLLMVIELVEGTTLSERIAKSKPSLRDGINYVCQVLQALAYAHGKGIIHRDIKPANMMITDEGVVKLMDFGIAKAAGDQGLTMAGSTVGSLAYMSPEQIQSQPLDGRADLYSLGASLYEIVTGKRPFKGDSDYAVMAAHFDKAPVPPIQLDPTLPTALNEIIIMALAKDPAQRFQSADAFRKALTTVKDSLEAEPVEPASVPAPVPGPLQASEVAAGTSVMRGGTSAITSGSKGRVAAPTPIAQASPAIGGVPGSAPALVDARKIDSASGRDSNVQPATPSPEPVPEPASSGGDRGFYMVAGAFLALLVVVVGAIELPKVFRTRAAKDAGAPTQPGAVNSPAPSSPSANQAGTSSSPVPTDVPASVSNPQTAPSPPTPAGSAEVTPAKQERAARNARQTISAAESKIQAAQTTANELKQSAEKLQSSAAQTAATDNLAAQEELKKLKKRFSLLDARARGVLASFEGLKDSQRAQGLSPNRELTSSAELLKQSMNDAHDALASGDAASAAEDLDHAEAAVEKLEKKFGG